MWRVCGLARRPLFHFFGVHSWVSIRTERLFLLIIRKYDGLSRISPPQLSLFSGNLLEMIALCA